MARGKKRRGQHRHGRAKSQGRRWERRACSRKRGYRTRLEAEIAQAHVANRHGHEKAIYRCTFCSRWHLGGSA